MKKTIISMLFLGLACSLNAQQYHSPQVFRNYFEYVQYQCENPQRIPLINTSFDRAISAYSLKLDSVVGSDDFDWTRWKNEYTYTNDNQQPYDNRNRTEIHYVWDRQNWQPELKSELRVDGLDENTLFSRWDGENWQVFSRVTYHYEEFDGTCYLNSVLTESFADTVWVGSNRITYTYDDLHHLELMTNYNRINSDGEWEANSKDYYTYNDEGALVKILYTSVRNGVWRENTKDSLIYDEYHRCVTLSTKRKGGFGPGGNTWRDASRYDFVYAQDGSLESETLYSSGWFGTEMSLVSKSQYQFDTKGNVTQKTVSIFNGADWIVRDVYENRFETSQEASSILGMTPLWKSTKSQGFGYVLDSEMSLYSQWLSCSMVSTMLDTQFDLYYSGFANVEEHAPAIMQVSSSNGKLIVTQEAEAGIVVYDLNGRVVASQSQTTRCEFILKPGLYLVSNGKSSVKAIVR